MGKNREELARLQEAIRAAGEVVYDWNLADDSITWYGDTAEVFGPVGTAGLATGEDFNRRVSPEDLQRRLGALTQHFHDHEPFDCEYRVRTGHSRFAWVHDRATVEFSSSGDPVRLLGILRPVNKRKQNEVRLEYLANYDELTGHYNKARLREALEHAIAYGLRYTTPGAYLVVGIDKLSDINDAFGHESGDAVIVAIGQRLERSLRTSDVIGRVGGDRFGVVLGNCPQASVSVAAEKILHAVRQAPVETPSGPIYVSVSVGGVSFPDPGDTAQDIMIKAETALGQAKAEGRNLFVPYRMSDAQRDARRHNMAIADRVRNALKENRLVFAYQPIVRAEARDVAYYECLLRMNEENGTPLAAAEFVPVVERLGLIRIVDRYVLELVVDELSRYPDITLAVNISGLTVADQSWLRALVALLKGKPDVAGRLIVEITETAALQDIEESARFVSTVRDLGCCIALDDFGAGYTSFRHLKSLPVDVVKIDGSFVRNVSKSVDNQLFVRTLLGLSEGFGLHSVAECVETADDAAFLVRQGVQYLQGHYFGRPTLERPWLSRAVPALAVTVPGARPTAAV